MTIGIDISPLQTHHRMRGIGYTVLNLINNLPNEQKQRNNFVFFKYSGSGSTDLDPLTLLNLEGLNYEVRDIKHRKRFSKKLPGKLYLINSALNQLIELRDTYFGDSRLSSIKDIDIFLQTDQSQSLPRSGRTKKVMILYDLIPYALEWEYLWSYQTARNMHGFSGRLPCVARLDDGYMLISLE